MKRKTKLQVLYVEDDADSRDLVSYIFGQSDIEVVLANTAAEAWQCAHDQPFDMYLLDGMLTAGPSLGLCRDLHKFTPNTPILFYSALAYQADVQNGMEAGANGYLVKPYFGDLYETVSAAIHDSISTRVFPHQPERSEEVMMFDHSRPIKSTLSALKKLIPPEFVPI
ncbi:MAG TPA: response regulator [Pyrinomonadaceae bacterium]|nr:response regulator [Pyrinomonadaceae bacterium]